MSAANRITVQMDDGTEWRCLMPDTFSLDSTRDLEVVPCAAADCRGCGAVHRRLTGEASHTITARNGVVEWIKP